MSDNIRELEIDELENVVCLRELEANELENVAGGSHSIIWGSVVGPHH